MSAGMFHPQEALLPEQAAIMAALRTGTFTTISNGLAGMPKVWLIEELQASAARIKARSDADHDLASRAIADALFDIASGFSDSACQAIQEAEVLRGLRA